MASVMSKLALWRARKGALSIWFGKKKSGKGRRTRISKDAAERLQSGVAGTIGAETGGAFVPIEHIHGNLDPTNLVAHDLASVGGVVAGIAILEGAKAIGRARRRRNRESDPVFSPETLAMLARLNAQAPLHDPKNKR